MTLSTCPAAPPAPDRSSTAEADADAAPRPRRRAGRRRGRALTVAAAVLVYAAFVVPDGLSRLKSGQATPTVFVRIPIELLAGAALLIAAPRRARRVAATALGLGLALLTLFKILDMGFVNALGRRFDPVLDWPLLADGYNYLTEAEGHATAVGAAVGAAAGALTLLVLLPLAAVRLAGSAARHVRPARRTVLALAAAWVMLAVTAVQIFPGALVASDVATRLAKANALKVPAALRDQRAFAAAARVDAFRTTPPDKLLAGLRGKDVVVAFVESYGRTVLEDPALAAAIGPALQNAGAELERAGFATRSGWLTSSTYGGGSWLAHASFESGLWIDNQSRYRQLVSSDRMTLAQAFRRGGWQTAAVKPGNQKHWPEAAFYGYDTVYDARNLGYRGPQFGWSSMPDQYALAQFQQRVYGPARGPLMADITLTSSHTPWAPTPHMIDWSDVGDGSVYGPIKARGLTKAQAWADKSTGRTEYARSVAYSVSALTSWAAHYGDDDLVLVFLGDHQPAPVVTGRGASHDVPITVVARDRTVLDRVAGWGWQPGLRPDAQAPVWPMDQFRDRFLTTFGAEDPAARARH